MTPLPRSASQAFGPYTLLGEIARGGMAEVLFARRNDTPTGELCALKRILPIHRNEPTFMRFFQAEAQLALQLKHQNLVETLEAGEVDGIPYLAMEYLHGRSLSRLIQAFSTRATRLALCYGAYVGVRALAGLEAAHQARDAAGNPLCAVLCDISPSNVVIRYDGEVKLIDFGIAVSRAKLMEQIGWLKGKKHFMAPEQLRGMPVGPPADVFSLGLTLLNLFAGAPVRAEKSEFELEEAIRQARLPRLDALRPEVPLALADVLARALAKEPGDRYPSALEFAAALAPFACLGKGQPVTAADFAKVLAAFVPSLKVEDDIRLGQVLSLGVGAFTDLPASMDVTPLTYEPGRTLTSHQH